LFSAEGEEDEVVWGVVVVVRGVAEVLQGCVWGRLWDGTGVDGWHRCCVFEREGWHRLRNRCLVSKGATPVTTPVSLVFFFLTFFLTFFYFFFLIFLTLV